MNVAALLCTILSTVRGRDADSSGEEPSLAFVLLSALFWGAVMLITWLVARWRVGLL
ncbi:MAG: hypothetical protein HDQ88_07425 [Clostridia bacterium]|nr:hypothetical protein [Clostridia bacterium]